MEQNPYQSPFEQNGNGDHTVTARPTLAQMARTGLLAGMLAGATYGAAGAFVLSISGSFFVMIQTRVPPFRFLGAYIAIALGLSIAGTIVGIICGLIVGIIGGAAAARMKPNRFRLQLITILPLSMIGILFGSRSMQLPILLSASAIGAEPSSFEAGMGNQIVGGVIGVFAGAFTGLALARGLANIAWPKRHSHSEKTDHS